MYTSTAIFLCNLRLPNSLSLHGILFYLPERTNYGAEELYEYYALNNAILLRFLPVMLIRPAEALILTRVRIDELLVMGPVVLASDLLLSGWKLGLIQDK